MLGKGQLRRRNDYTRTKEEARKNDYTRTKKGRGGRRTQNKPKCSYRMFIQNVPLNTNHKPPRVALG